MTFQWPSNDVDTCLFFNSFMFSIENKLFSENIFSLFFSCFKNKLYKYEE